MNCSGVFINPEVQYFRAPELTGISGLQTEHTLIIQQSVDKNRLMTTCKGTEHHCPASFQALLFRNISYAPCLRQHKGFKGTVLEIQFLCLLELYLLTTV